MTRPRPGAALALPWARGWRALTLQLLLIVLTALPGQAHGAGSGDAGEAIFRRGQLATGAALEAHRDGGLYMQGADAACINCHRRSGLGAKVGLSSIPPITGRYLFRPQNGEDPDLPFVDGVRNGRDAYTDATVARAIREGLDSQGQPLSYLMPRFTMSDFDMAALIGYLKGLDQRKTPGVMETELHFATIITPDADPTKRRGMLDVLEHYFAEKNTFPIGATPALRSSRKMMYMANRHWQLHVWQLNGPESTWQQQLQQHLAAEPVFAVISGLGGKNWAPVHAFCEQAALPCLFPNVDAPVDHPSDFYSIYFSGGVLLEARLIAKSLLAPENRKAAKSVLQIYRANDSGETGAKALATALRPHGIATSGYTLRPGESVAMALRHSRHADALVLWLRPADIAALGPQPPPAPAGVFLSGLLGGLEQAPLPAGWRDVTHIAYPVDLPERRRVRVDYAFGWFSIRHIPVVAEQMQADTFLACGLLAETLSHMSGTFVRDYLVERIEDMIEHRLITGYYPRLTLAQGQRFASKGGFMVHFTKPDNPALAADGDWMVP
ncbi:hypothetical protein [Vogesella sp. LIG4]|uniref:hypothetical protein n=1 Tax=Vogesella sp. LIG4 TaxID=1192162 RepID=UPI000820222C|nr:hypothetical protein [Vogesella sp. LIG4]SCK24512.1 hypothetical protein PSELUDRAFT_2884 [Vogesella sp. LIG4]